MTDEDEEEEDRRTGGETLRLCVASRLLDSFVAVLPAELENVPDDFLHQLEGLLDLRRHQRGEVDHPHVHLQEKRNAHTLEDMVGGKEAGVGVENGSWSCYLAKDGKREERRMERERERGGSAQGNKRQGAGGK